MRLAGGWVTGEDSAERIVQLGILRCQIHT